MKHFAWLAGPAGILLVIAFVVVAGPLRAVHEILVGLTLLCATGTVVGIGYTLLAAALIGRFFARSPSEPTSFPPVTVVKPLHGAEWALLNNLSSFCQQDYPGLVQFLFGVHDPADPALQTLEDLRRLHPDAHITAVADARLYGPNRKISNILNMLPHAQHDVFVFADSDVPTSLGVKVTLDGMTNDVFELLQIESPYRGSMFEVLSPLYHTPSCCNSSYFNLAPFGTSSANVAITGFPSSPTEAANNIPCDS